MRRTPDDVKTVVRSITNMQNISSLTMNFTSGCKYATFAFQLPVATTRKKRKKNFLLLRSGKKGKNFLLLQISHSSFGSLNQPGTKTNCV